MAAAHPPPSSRGAVASHVLPSVWLAVAAVLLFALPAAAEVGSYRCEDNSKVYLGNPRLFQRPAVVSCDRVYREIPEYREVLEKGLTDKDVRYHFLMKKASERFTKAVRAMARANDHDLVAEIGAVVVVKEGAAEPPDRTQAVIDLLG